MSAFNKNVDVQKDEGKPIDQAIAISYSALQKACLSKDMAKKAQKEKWTPSKIIAKGKGKKEDLEGLSAVKETLDKIILILCEDAIENIDVDEQFGVEYIVKDMETGDELMRTRSYSAARQERDKHKRRGKKVDIVVV